MFQFEEDAYMHAMRSPHETAQRAEERMQGFINEQLQYYEAFDLIGTFLEDDSFKQAAYFHLGMALHPIMDSTCPSHKGFQVWYGISLRSPFHEDPESISTELTKETVNLMLKTFRYGG
jgi:hypothetical protein